MKRTVMFFILILTLVFSLYANAATKLQASKLPNFPYDYRDYVVLNDDYLIFSKPDIVDNGIRRGVYTYNLKTYQVQLLFNTIALPYPYESALRPSSYFVGINHIFVIVDGQLYVTNGTAAGSRMIQDFGYDYCCYDGAQYNSRIGNGYVDGNDLYFTYSTGSFYVDDRARSVWVSDGTPAGTNQISESYAFDRFDYRPFGIFKNKNYQADAIFYITDYKLWKSVNGNQVELVQEVPFNTMSNRVQTINGTFFCAYDSESASSHPNQNGDLWRFSNSGVLQVKAGGCDGFRQLFNNANIVYYENEQGLWIYDVATGNNRLIYSGYIQPEYSFSNYIGGKDQCLINGNLYKLAITRMGSAGNYYSKDLKLLEIAVDGSVREIVHGLDDIEHLGGIRGLSCFTDGFAVTLNYYYNYPQSYKSHTDELYYTVGKNTFDKVDGIPTSYTSSFVNNTTPKDGARFIAHSRWPHFMNLLNYEPIIIAPIIDLLLDEQ